MTLERLAAEVESKSAAELAESERRHEAAKAKLLEEKARRIEEIQKSLARQASEEARRELQRRGAGAKMQARKFEYEARERALGGSLVGARAILAEFTESPAYPDVLRRMYAYAVDRLGKEIRISGRAADASVLKSIAGKSFDPAPAAILGGLVAESTDGSRRLSLSFDELLRLREPQLRELLAS